MKSRINREAREISISELWWYVISKWKWLVIGMVVGALVLGAYGVYSAYRANESAKANVPKEYTMEDLTPEEQAEVEALIEDYKFYQEELKRLGELYIMSIDFSDVTYCMLTYYIDTDYSFNYLEVSENYTSTLMSIYKTYVHSEVIHERIMSLGIEGLEKKDIMDICHVSSEGGILKVSIDSESEWSQEIAKVLCEEIEKYHAKAVELVGAHTLTKISEDRMVIHSEAIKNAQKYKTDAVDELLENVNKKKNEFTPNQLDVFDKEIDRLNEKHVENEGVIIDTIKTRDTIKVAYIVIGAILGIVIAVVLIVWSYISDKKIKNLRELKQVYDIEIIGKILRDNIPGKRFIKKSNEIINNLDEKEQAKYVTDVIISKCECEKIKGVVICSSVAIAEEVAKDIVKKLCEKDIDCKFVNDINYNRLSLAEVVNTGNVIIMELINQTKRNDLESEIELCDKLSINIIGMIAVI